MLLIDSKTSTLLVEIHAEVDELPVCLLLD